MKLIHIANTRSLESSLILDDVNRDIFTARGSRARQSLLNSPPRFQTAVAKLFSSSVKLLFY
jgi:hypothetical protein